MPSMIHISILLNAAQARPRRRATSPAIPGRRIGRADGLDLAFPGHFAKKSSNLGHFAKMTTTFCKKVLELRTFCKKVPGHFAKKSSNLGHFAKKPSTFCKKVLELRPFCKKVLELPWNTRSCVSQTFRKKSPRT